MIQSAAEIVREYGPFPSVDSVNGVTYDGQQVWFAAGDKLNIATPYSKRNWLGLTEADQLRPRGPGRSNAVRR